MSASPRLKGFGGKTQENILRGLQQLSDSGGRVLVNVALDVAEALLDELSRLKQVQRAAYAGSLRRMRETIGDVDLLVASERGRADHGHVRRAAVRLPRDRARGHEVVDPDRARLAGRPACRAQGCLGRGHDLLHRLEGAQRPDPRAGGARRAEVERVRAVRCEDGRPPRRRDGATGLRASRAAVHRADAAGGSRRGRGGARRRAAEGPAAQGPPRRSPYPHQPDRRAGPARGDAAHRRDVGLRLLRRDGSRPEPGDAADDRRQDPRATRTAPGVAVRARDDAAARNGAEHRPGRQRRLARGLPRRVRPDRWRRCTRTSTSRARS